MNLERASLLLQVQNAVYHLDLMRNAHGEASAEFHRAIEAHRECLRRLTDYLGRKVDQCDDSMVAP